MPYIHVPHVFYPYFCSFSIEYKTRQYHCRSLGAVLDTLVKTSAKTAKQGENLQPDLVWNSRQADKLLNLLTAYLSGYVACRIFVPFSYPFLQLHFHQEQMLNLTFMNAEWSLVTHQHLCTVQSPVSIASLCVAVTSPSSPPPPPVTHWDSIFCPVSFLAPSFSPSLSFQHNPSCLWKLLRRTGGWTHRGAFSFLQTQSFLSPALKMQTDEKPMQKCSRVRCEGDKTRCGIWSSERRSATVVPA